MNDLIKAIKEFYLSRYGKPFALAFVGYCVVSLYLSPELTGDELELSKHLWFYILDFDSIWISRFNLSHLAYYFPLKTLCFLGFPAIMGAYLAAFFGDQLRPEKQTAVFCWAMFYHPKPFYPEILEATINHFLAVIATVVAIYFIVGVCINKYLRNNLNKLPFQMLFTVFISILAAILIIGPYYEISVCTIERERAQLDWERVKNEWIFMTHFNPIIAFLFAYLGISIMTRLIPALIKPDKAQSIGRQ